MAAVARTHDVGRLDEVPGLFATMPPMPGAIDTYENLAHLGKSARERLILSHHKRLNRGDFLADDRTRNGADRFEGRLLLFGGSARRSDARLWSSA